MSARGAARLVDLRLLMGVAGLSVGINVVLLRRMTTAGSWRKARSKIVLLGDSITQLSFQEGGWGAALANRYQRRCDVLNRGYSGYNSRWILELLKHESIERGKEVALWIVFLGANDASLAEHNLRQHVPLDEYRANLRRIAAYRGDGPVVFVAPPPVCHAQRLEYQRQRYGARATGVLERTNENAGRYASACRDVAKELRVPCLDLWSIMQDHDDWPKFLHDGLHLSAAGNRFLAEHLVELIQTAFPELAVLPDPHTGFFGTSGTTSRLQPHAPWHDLIDHADPSRSFTSLL